MEPETIRHFVSPLEDRLDHDVTGQMRAQTDARMLDLTDTGGTGLNAAHHGVLTEPHLSQAMTDFGLPFQAEHSDG